MATNPKIGFDPNVANAEPFKRHSEFHESLNIKSKILSASAAYMVRHLEESGDPKELGRLIARADTSWRYPPVWSMEKYSLSDLNGFISEFGVVGIFSAVDEFMVGVDAEVARWNANAHNTIKLATAATEESEDNRIENFYKKYGWKTTNVKAKLAILKYFMICRNCVAHRSSRVSPGLSQYSKSKPLQEALNQYVPKTKNNTLPKLEIGELIKLGPKTVLYCSHLAAQVAWDIDVQLVTWLGLDGIVNMAAHHAMLNDERVPTVAHRSLEAVLKAVLADRYRVRVGREQLVQILKGVGQWNACLKAYEEKFPKKK